MAKVAVYNWNKEQVAEVELEKSVFEAPIRKDLMHAVVKWQLAKRRQGTHKTKTRGEVSGGGKKPFKQKGTGNARQGSSRSPLHPGGGTTFGPQPRNYEYSLPKKVKKGALRSALSYLVSEGKFFVVENMASEAGKTKEMAGRLNKLGLQKAVLFDAESDEMVRRATQNLEGFAYGVVESINVYDLLKYDAAVVTQSSLDKIIQRCAD